MKKLALTVSALLMVAALSCTRELEVNLPEGQEYVFEAVWADGSDTRTAIQSDGTSVWWTVGEEINVFYGAEASGKFTSTNTEPSQYARFTGTLPVLTGTVEEGNGAEAFWGVYPYNAANTCDGESVTLTVPSNQSAAEGTFADKFFPAVGRSNDFAIAFYNVCGGVRFSVVNTGIESVTFQSIGGESLVGKVKVAFDADGKPVIQEVRDGLSEVTVTAPEGGFVPGEYYFAAFLPGTLSNGLKVTFHKGALAPEVSFDSPITVNRSRFGTLANKDEGLFDSTIPVEEFFLMPSEAEILVGNTIQLTAIVLPSNATNRLVVFASLDESVATVSNIEGLVTGVAPGNATIMAGIVGEPEKWAFCSVTVKENNPVPEIVDLGLSVKWASCNVGASKPEEYGNYYAWGDISPMRELTGWRDYPYCYFEEPNGGVVFKYNVTSSSYYDGKRILDLHDDAAHMSLGDKWRTPTWAELLELRDLCTWEWTSQNGIIGCKVTGPSGNSIFLPAGGDYCNIGDPPLLGSAVYLWSSSLCGITSLQSSESYYLLSLSNSQSNYLRLYKALRYMGMSIRPVYADPTIPEGNVFIDKTALQLSVGQTEGLRFFVIPEGESLVSANNVTWSSSNESVATVSAGLVRGIAAGSAIITGVTGNGKTATCKVTVTQPYSVATPEAIDLGLSVKWASFNLGASSPEEYGDYYAWGEIETYYEDGYAQSESPVWKSGKSSGYYWSSYKWCRLESPQLYFTKYCLDPEKGLNGYVDSHLKLLPEDDAAQIKLGGKWRMPTIGEMKELIEMCTWERSSMNGIGGRRVTGPNGNSIFLPAAGFRRSTQLYYLGQDGEYWTSSLLEESVSVRAYSLYFGYYLMDWEIEDRNVGLSIRPVSY